MRVYVAHAPQTYTRAHTLVVITVVVVLTALVPAMVLFRALRHLDV